jgi:hypothetical protein
MKTRQILPLAVLTGLLLCGRLHAQIFVADADADTVDEYNLNGTPVGSGTLIKGLDNPRGIAVSGGDIFVANYFGNDILEYTTAGAPVGTGTLASGISGGPFGIAVSGSDVFVSTYSNQSILEYTTSGSLVQTITNGVFYPAGLAISGSNLFAVQADSVAEFTTSGSYVTSLNPAFLLEEPDNLAISGSNIFAANNGNSQIVEFTTAGTPVGSGTLVASVPDVTIGIAALGGNIYVSTYAASDVLEYTSAGVPVGTGTLVAGPSGGDFTSIAVIPEPSTWALLAMGGAGLLLFALRRRANAQVATRGICQPRLLH